MMQRIALVQMCSGINPAANALTLQKYAIEAARQGAEILFTPEMTGMLDRDRKRAAGNISCEADDLVLTEAKKCARELNMWIAIGSLALKSDQPRQEKWVNRSFLINSSGEVIARYDKIHLFDVDLDTGESWKESAAYLGGDTAVIAQLPHMKLGLSICYDLRFPDLYRSLTNAGANVLAVPAAFTVPTGQAHWETLLKARAIEAGVYVIAAAQSGRHEDGRETYGHSMVIDPWGTKLIDMRTEEGVAICKIDMAKVTEVQNRIPSVANRRHFKLPNILS